MKQVPGWKELIELCLKLKSEKEFNDFFDLFLTIEEKNMVASRYLIIKSLVEKKLSQREIAKAHGVSMAQINRGSNALKRAASVIEGIL